AEPCSVLPHTYTCCSCQPAFIWIIGALAGHIKSASMVRSTASVTDSVPRTRRIGGPQGPSRNNIHRDQSRIAKFTTLAVRLKRRGAASRAGCEAIAVFGLPG